MGAHGVEEGSHWASSSGPRYPYPKWVWTPTGGWWAQPKYWRQNTMGVVWAVVVPFAVLTFYASSQLEERHRPPSRWHPAMLYAKEYQEGGKWHEYKLKYPAPWSRGAAESKQEQH